VDANAIDKDNDEYENNDNNVVEEEDDEEGDDFDYEKEDD